MLEGEQQTAHVVEVLVGQVIAGRYRVDQLLGEGGMALVFRGEHLGLSRAVAIKVLKPHCAQIPELAARFDREARAASRFDHPNCRQVIDCGVAHGFKFMAMPLLEGRELTCVQGRRLPPAQCVAIAMQITAGLDHIHKFGVVHRDLKPDNVFVTRDHDGREVMKIVDFGIARLIEDQGDGLTTKVGAVVGTPAYMSPEQAMGHDADQRADLYSVGVMMYEMLAGHLPFHHPNPRDIMRDHVMTSLPPLPREVPKIVTSLLGGLLAKRPEGRYRDAAIAMRAMGQVAHALRRDATPWVRLLDLPQRRRTTAELPRAADVARARPAASPPKPSRPAYGRAPQDHDSAAQAQLSAVGDALDRVLNSKTPAVALRDGIMPTPLVKWDASEIRLGEIGDEG